MQSPEHQSTEYRIASEPVSGQVRAYIDHTPVAESSRAVVVHESGLPSRFYLPAEDFVPGVLRPGDQRTFCPFKGTATHWSLQLHERRLENVAWSYERPLEQALAVGGYVAFYEGVVEWEAPPSVLAAIEGMSNAAPKEAALSDWVLREAWLAGSSSELTEQLARAIGSTGTPLSRLQVGIWTLHPQLVGKSYLWRKGDEGVQVDHLPRGALQEPEYLNSPVRFVSEGLGGVRQRLDVDDPEFQFPIMQSLRAAGATDYVAMPLWFSDGQVNTLTLAADSPTGFSVADLGRVFEVLPVLSRLYEIHTLRENTRVLLDTYLGPRTGARVLNGLTQRGDGETINAVIWFCDLRESTHLADRLPRERFLDLLNEYFDAMAGAVLSHGGEVLRFVGDAVLAIFPIVAPGDHDDASGTTDIAEVCRCAVQAVHSARDNMAVVNARRAAEGTPVIGYGIGLHIGEVTYGNIGTPERLEFTVIGAAANEAARVESLCKPLGKNVLFSEQFARHYPAALTSTGRHGLRGAEGQWEIFTLPESGADERVVSV